MTTERLMWLAIGIALGWFVIPMVLGMVGKKSG